MCKRRSRNWKSRPAYKTYLTYGKPLTVHVGKNGKRQVNLYDPDGTRVELMEAQTVDGKPRLRRPRRHRRRRTTNVMVLRSRSQSWNCCPVFIQ